VKFGSIQGAVRLSSGILVVADAGNASLHFYDPSERRGRSVGRQGSGPGEFRLMGWMGRCRGDSVFVWDAGTRALMVFDSIGRFADQSRVLTGNSGPAPYVMACSDGVFAMQPAARAPERGSPIIRGEAPVVIVDTRRGTESRTLSGVPGGEMVIIGGGAGPRPLGKQTSLAVGSGRIYIGTGDSASVLVSSTDGHVIGAIRVKVASAKATRDDYVRAVDRLVENVPAPVRSAVRGRYLELPLPDYLPPYFAILADPEGALWVVTSPPGAATRLQAYDAAGRLLADVQLSLPLTVMDIGHDFILGAYEDSSGEPHLVSFRLQRAR
jgi:hypothetical protein